MEVDSNCAILLLKRGGRFVFNRRAISKFAKSARQYWLCLAFRQVTGISLLVTGQATRSRSMAICWRALRLAAWVRMRCSLPSFRSTRTLISFIIFLSNHTSEMPGSSMEDLP